MPASGDAFCPECRRALDEPPVAPGIAPHAPKQEQAERTATATILWYLGWLAIIAGASSAIAASKMRGFVEDAVTVGFVAVGAGLLGASCWWGRSTRTAGQMGIGTVQARQELVDVLRQARALLALPSNDFGWSSWADAPAALAELDRLIAAIESGRLPPWLDLAVVFAPTGPVQEVSLSSGWAQEFLVVAGRFDAAAKKVYACAM